MVRRVYIQPASAHPRPLLRAVILFAVTLAMAGSAAHAAKVGTRYDRDADFDGLQTFAWRSKSNVPADAPLAVGGKIDTMIRGIVTEELERRGFRPATGDEEADFELSYDALRETVLDSPGVRKEIVRGVAWVVDIDARTYDQGTLQLSVHRSGTEHAVWSAWTSGKVTEPDPEQPNPNKIRRAVRKMLARFPPR